MPVKTIDLSVEIDNEGNTQVFNEELKIRSENCAAVGRVNGDTIPVKVLQYALDRSNEEPHWDQFNGDTLEELLGLEQYQWDWGGKYGFCWDPGSILPGQWLAVSESGEFWVLNDN